MIDTQVIDNEIDSKTFEHLHETRKWTMFLSIAGFVFIGIMILVVVIAGSTAGSLFPGGGGVTTFLPLILIVGIYFFPIYYLFKFSSVSKQALLSNDSSLISQAFKYLKYHYRFMGILFIIMMGIYIILGIIMLISGTLFNGF